MFSRFVRFFQERAHNGSSKTPPKTKIRNWGKKTATCSFSTITFAFQGYMWKLKIRNPQSHIFSPQVTRRGTSVLVNVTFLCVQPFRQIFSGEGTQWKRENPQLGKKNRNLQLLHHNIRVSRVLVETQNPEPAKSYLFPASYEAWNKCACKCGTPFCSAVAVRFFGRGHTIETQKSATGGKKPQPAASPP